jgi:hypothetical protein
MLTKYAEVADRGSQVEVLDGFAVPANVGQKRLARVRRKAHRHHFEYTPRRGYIYVRSRAISSRCNDNFDEFPAAEIKAAYRTFIGKPVFVNHHNADHRRARGVIVDAALHEDTNPDGSEDTWAEVLMEVDAVRFPVLAREVLKGNIARTSMGTDVAYSVCTACGNKAATPADYCQHIPAMKGMKHRRFNAAAGVQEEVLIAERCYGLGFFENSLLVEDPADPTAYVLGVDGGEGLSAAAAKQIVEEAETVVREAAYAPTGETYTSPCDTCGKPVTFGWLENEGGFRTSEPVDGGGSDHLSTWCAEHTPSRRSASRHEAFPSRRDMADSLEGRAPRQQQRETPKAPQAPKAPKAPGAPRVKREPNQWDRAADEQRRADERNQKRLDRLRQRDPDPDWEARGQEYEKTHPRRASAVETLLQSEAGMMDTEDDWSGGWGNPDGGAAFDWGSRVTPNGPVRIYRGPDGHARFYDQRGNQLGLEQGSIDAAFAEAESLGWSDPANGIGFLSSKQAGSYADRPEVRDWYKERRKVTYTDGTPVKPGDRIRYHQAPGGLLETHNTGNWTYGTAVLIDSIVPGVQELVIENESTASWGGREKYNLYGHVVERDPRKTSRHVHSYGETKAPTKVDTMRAENCPVCGDDEGYNGDKCSVCGYMQPPSQFTDPDLTKARENDLRQDQEQAPMPADVGMGLDDPAPTDPLQCTNCGEVFSAEGEPAPGPEDPEAEAVTGPEDEDPFAEPEDPEDAPADESDPDEESLDDLSDDEIFADEEDEDDPEDKEDDEVEDLPVDPAVGEARITAEPADDPKGLEGVEIVPNMTCPICGEGTLVPQAGQEPTGAEPKMKEVGTDPTTKPKETVGMSQQQNSQNPAQQRRSQIIAAIAEQQGVIERQAQTIQQQDAQLGVLTRAVAALSIAAGVEKHPHFAKIVRQAGMTRRADTNQGDSTGEAPATTTEEAKKPDATDDPESLGAAPAPANAEVTPEGVTDVNTTDVVANPPVLDNLQDPTAPVSGTDAVVPAAGDAAGTSTVKAVPPSNEAFDKPGDSGWKSSAKERFIASQRLARLQIAAGMVAQGTDDLALAQEIDSSKDSLGEINAKVATIAAIQQKAASAQPTQGQRRHLVPRAAQGGVQPSRQPSLTTTAADAGREGEDSWLFGGDDLG